MQDVRLIYKMNADDRFVAGDDRPRNQPLDVPARTLRVGRQYAVDHFLDCDRQSPKKNILITDGTEHPYPFESNPPFAFDNI